MNIFKKSYKKCERVITDKTKIFFTQKHEKKLRSQLKNYDFSIICSNCIGGIIYHRLGLKFLSPTINLFIYQNDYLKFVLNLKDYLEKELMFIETDEKYPVAKLGDITIYFNHYKTDEEARESWNKRKERINYNNLFIIMYDKDGLSEDDLAKLKKIDCKGKIVISNRTYSNLDYVIKIPADMNDYEKRYRLDTDKFTGKRTFEKHFDYVKWLNEGN
ncbi:MAG: DUF1919 domain-containing protein [Bacillota bacterium]|nr:DUF1919 domain-containing protein [Bacillota bacterium]